MRGGRYIHITEFSDPRLDVYSRLSENQLVNREDPSAGLFIAESPLVIGRALDAGYKPVSLLVEDRHIEGEAREILGRMPDIPVFTAPFEVLTNLTGYKLTRGALCAMRRPAGKTPDEICRKGRRIVLLAHVMNPTNVGAIFRSAAALGMDGVLLTEDCSDPLYRRAIRVSMGNVFSLPWAYIKPAGTEIRYLKEQGFLTLAMALREDSVSPDDPRLKNNEKLAVVLGSEGEGLPQAVIDECDQTICIPMSRGTDSLNVSNAAAIAFWELGLR